MKHALILQHVPFEGPAMIKNWLDRHHFVQSQHQSSAITDWSRLPEFDWLIIMGGPMSAADEQHHPWIKDELAFIKRAIGDNKKILGVCLGSQLIARALGGDVYRAPEPEIGWFPVIPTPAGQTHPVGQLFSEQPTVLHWHGDTFTLPDSAEVLLTSKAGNKQLFVQGNNIMGIQCHLEMLPEQVERLCHEGADALAKGGIYVEQPEQLLRSQTEFDRLHALMFRLLDGVAAS